MSTTYEVIDTKTGKLIATYTDRNKATRRADKLDNAYGAVRYIVRPIFA